jgi:hypothetical protein
MNLEVTTTIKTVIGDVMFLAHMIESKDIGNAVRIKINFVVTKISNSCSGHQPLVEVDIDGSGRWADVGDIQGLQRG